MGKYYCLGKITTKYLSVDITVPKVKRELWGCATSNRERVFQLSFLSVFS